MTFTRVWRFLRSLWSSLFFQAGALVFLAFLIPELPGWMRGAAWFCYFGAGFVLVCTFLRDGRTVLAFLMPRLSGGWQRLAVWNDSFAKSWKYLTIFLAAVVVIIAFWRAFPVWTFMAESSLREDEIGSVRSYSAQGLHKTVTTYKLAKNHIFFNVLNTLLPGADSVFPLRARALSFVAVAAALAVLVWYSARRGWLLAGVICAGLVAGNIPAMKVLLEARGYGLLCFFAMAGCVGLAEWLKSGRRIWLYAMVLSCVLGTYSLPYYLIFGGGLLVSAFLLRPSRETFLAGAGAVAGVGVVYLPVLVRLYEVFTGYSEKYGADSTAVFATMEGVFLSIRYFLPPEWITVGPLSFLILVLVVLLFAGFARFACREDRLAVVGVLLAVLGMLVFWYCVVSAPIRTAAFLCAPFAFVGTVIAGSCLSARALVPIRPLPSLILAGCAALVLGRPSDSEPLLPAQNWHNLKNLIERSFSPEKRVWVNGRRINLIGSHLGRERIAPQGELDSEALARDGLVAIESIYRGGDEEITVRRGQLPDDVRFVTAPLIVGYQRAFFRAPPPDQIVSISANGRVIAKQVPGRQVGDPEVLANSLGNGDYLEKQPTTVEQARPDELPLPVSMEVDFGSKSPEATASFLFTQGLRDKTVTAEIQDADGKWRKAGNVFILSELLSIRIPDPGCKKLRIRVEPAKAPSRPGRPAFGLLAAWLQGVR